MGGVDRQTITANVCDDEDIKKEMRNLCARSNTLNLDSNFVT